ncbi:MAG TPA: peptidase MA family metallohydrolase [Dehalococcoidia bacterium]|nr:peptidase MA family metallohydrolase [Dehalococcoidia bacterium]
MEHSEHRAAPKTGQPLRIGLLGLAVALLTVLAGGATLARPAAVRADDPLTVNGTPSVQNSFPNEMVFNIDAASAAGNVTDVQLHYTLVPDPNQHIGRADFDQGPSVHAQFHLRTSTSQGYLPPFKTIHYFWTLVDAAGNKMQTDAADFIYADPRFPFKQLSNGNLTLHYYNGTDTAARNILNIGRQALDKASQLDGAPLDFPIQLVVYGNQAEVAAALSHESKSSDPNILGQANAPDIVVLDAGDLRGAENEDTVRHELTHLVNARAVKDGVDGSLPLWLDEGLAVFSQSDPGGFRDAVNQAIAQDQVVSLKNLSPGYRGSNPDVFYGEAWSLTRFLVGTYGPDKMAKLLAAFNASQSPDQAFTAIYGQNRDGIYNAWRKSVGLPAAAVASGTQAPPARNAAAAAPAPSAESAGAANAQGTQPPDTAPVRSKPATSSSGDTTVTVVLAVAGVAIFLALLAIAITGGLMLSKRGGRPS